MSKKTWIMISCLVLSLALGLSGSLAYLTDTDTKVNTFTMGNVDIEVEEDFNHGAKLNPGVTVEKHARIDVHGENDAWVWMTVSVPADIDDIITLNWTDQVRASCGEIIREEVDNFVQYTVLYYRELAPSESTENLLESVTMSDLVDKLNGNWVKIVDGEPVNIDTDLSKFDIIVTGYAIQVDGFESVEDARAAYKAQWVNQDVPTVDSDDEFTYLVHSTEELQAELNDPNNKVITLASGEYGHVTLGSADNLTIRAAVNADPVMKGITIKSGVTIHGLSFDNITFEDKGIEFEFNKGVAPWSHVHDLSVNNCRYYGERSSGSLVSILTSSPGSNQFHNVYISNCEVNGAYQGLLLGGFADGSEVKILNNTFTNIGHNAIALRSGKGEIVVEGNTIVNGSETSASFRIGTLTAPVSVLYKNNAICETNTENSMYYECNSVPEGSVAFEGNTVDGEDWNPLQ